MKLLSFTKTYRNIVRVKEILQVLTKHGFGHIISRLNLAIYIPNFTQFGLLPKLPSQLSEDSLAIRVRTVFQELGPTFVKLGQILSGRPDILPQEFIQEFKLLQDRVPPFEIEKALEIIEEEFEAPADKIFSTFDTEVLASGSIGQVHCATLPDNTEVIVKIRRPGIEKVISTDISILKFFAQLIEKYIEEMAVFQPVLIVDEFSRTIRKELDFTAEAAYTEKFHSLLKEEGDIYSPMVYWEYITSKIITLQKLKGTNIGEREKLENQGINFITLSQNYISSFMKQYFVWGLFHADPHPGNILVSEKGKLYLIDFGMVGHLSNDLKNQLASVLLAIARSDISQIIEIYSDIGVFSEPVNEKDLKRDILEMIDKYFNIPFQHMDISKVFQDFVSMARNYQIILPRDFVLLGKSLVMSTAVARDLDPNFNLADAISPHISAILKEKFSPKRLINLTFNQMWSYFTLLQRLPSDIKEILRRIKAGNLRITLRHEAIDKHIRDVDRIANRLSFSLVLSAIIIASSILIMSKVGPMFQGIPVMGLIGYLFAILLGLWLFIAILRSGRL